MNHPSPPIFPIITAMPIQIRPLPAPLLIFSDLRTLLTPIFLPQLAMITQLIYLVFTSVSVKFNLINSLDVNKSPGSDGIPPTIFKSCNYIISRILWILFNKSLDSGTFASAWKTCLVCCIFKGGIKTPATSYRPISLQNVMPKLMENIITAKLSFFFAKTFLLISNMVLSLDGLPSRISFRTNDSCAIASRKDYRLMLFTPICAKLSTLSPTLYIFLSSALSVYISLIGCPVT